MVKYDIEVAVTMIVSVEVPEDGRISKEQLYDHVGNKIADCEYVISGWGIDNDSLLMNAINDNTRRGVE